MGLIRKIITYGMIFSIGVGIGTGVTKCNIERKYELLPKEGVEMKVEENYQQKVEFIEPRNVEYKFTIDDYVK